MKYIKAGLRRIFSLIHCLYIKVFHWKNFHFGIEEMISNNAHFSFSDKGKISIGKRNGLRRHCEISVSKSGKITIGDDTFFNNGCIVACHQEITIGSNTRFGPNVIIYDHDYDFRNPNLKMRKNHISSSVVIGNNVWVGGNSVILRGTEIGDNCVIAAGSVVKGKIEANTLFIQSRNELQSCIR
nr:acyltransferase [uncultured Agathobacter sp.]